MNKDVSSFLDSITKEIKYSKVHKSISEEIASHIEELKDDFMSEGFSEDESYKKAVECMGNPSDIGKDLHKTHKPRVEWSIFMLIAILVGIGLYGLLMYSLYYYENVIYKQIIWVALGITILFVGYFINYKKIEKYSLHLYIGIMLMMTVAIILGDTVNGARNYIIFLGISARISSIGMPFLIISYAGIVKKYCTGSLKTLVIILLMGIPSLALNLVLLDTSRVFILFVAYSIIILTVIFSENYKKSKRASLLILGLEWLCSISLGALFIVTNPYRLQRFTIFLNPYADPEGSGYLFVKLKELWNSTKFIGDSGSLVSRKNGEILNQMPNLETDFIFTFISSSMGWIVGVIIITMLVAVIIRLFLSSRKLNDLYGKTVCMAICVVFALEVIINILMNLGYSPITGCGLPFISYGGSDIVSNALLMGVFLGIYRRKDILICEQ